MSRLTLIALSLCVALVLYLLSALHSPDVVKGVRPSPWLGQTLPAVFLPSLNSDTPRNPIPSKHSMVVINFFASWCFPCLLEHPLFLQLKNNPSHDVTIIGIAYNDSKDNVIDWLAREGDPYDAVFFDMKGLASIPWGVVGVPESFIINGDGIVVHHERGAFDETRLAAWFGS